MNNTPTYFEALKWASLFIQEHQGDENAPQIILMDMMGWNKTTLIMHYRNQINSNQWEAFQSAVNRVVVGEPVQYITHQAPFFGRNFYVDQRVLIPRMETEELIEEVLNKTAPSQSLRILDIGTGSGNIAITLKLERPEWQVTAVDISRDALEVAHQNAQQLKADVDFELGSLFDAVQDQQYDVIISNPPYIAENEKNVMDSSVINFEPHIALFAEDEGLFWYKQIADQLDHYLANGGQLFCEIGYHQGHALKEYFSKKVYVEQLEIIQDLSQHDRILWVKKIGDEYEQDI